MDACAVGNESRLCSCWAYGKLMDNILDEAERLLKVSWTNTARVIQNKHDVSIAS
ncbi:hypothetical protein DPMN_193867 [Dreissena polymorpha]|uniref:Uncharacterized protein n=1 Tax=Dreissena polymorpha TaxID=45954 RepID=A0A9D3Y2W3_DREPO|nr:hypothetical protein DPMN_193867 [Dreissena polymorpha]